MNHGTNQENQKVHNDDSLHGEGACAFTNNEKNQEIHNKDLSRDASQIDLSDATTMDASQVVQSDYSVTDSTFAELNMDLLDHLWPVSKFPTWTTPDGHVTDRTDWANSAAMMRDTKVEVIVGKEKRRFLVPESLLCLSPYFQAVFRGGFKEQAVKRSVLPEANSAAFSMVLEALLLGRFNMHKIWAFKDLKSSGRPHTTLENRRNLGIWIHIVWITDLLQLQALKEAAENEVAKRLKDDLTFIAGLTTSERRKRRCGLTNETLIEIYQRTPPGSRLRTLVKERTFQGIARKWIRVEKYADFFAEFPEVSVEFMARLQQALPLDNAMDDRVCIDPVLHRLFETLRS